MSTRVRGWLLVVTTLVLGVMGALHPNQAWAADDQVDSWKIDYTVQRDGTVRASETLVYRFGTTGRQGITRSFVTRESWDDKSDAVYTVRNWSVKANGVPERAAAQVDEDGRDEYLTLRIGTPGRYIQTRTVTYTIDYEVVGALRTFNGYDEFYWDVVSGETPLVKDLDVSVTVPGGVKDVSCSIAAPGQRGACTSSRVNAQRGEFTQDRKPAGQIMTVGAKIGPGLVSNNAPVLQERADAADIATRNLGLGGALLSLAVSPVVGLMHYRRRGRDLRYVGLPPGVLPGAGENVPQKPSGRIEIPVAFSPPQISVAEAGLLVDGVLDTRESTATLVDLAVKGAVKLASEPGSATVRLVDPSKATLAHEQVLLQRLFAGDPDGEIDLSEQGSMHRAHTAMVTSVRNQVAANRWFTAIPSAAGAGFGCSGILMLGFAWFFFGGAASSALWLLAPLVPIIITALVVKSKMRRGQRSGAGRALTDQVEGFRTYLATAEAGQLKFEEGEDIFSRYLPWAILFGLADRWADLCADLVRQGRLSAEPPVWYYGPYNQWNFYVFNSSLNTIDHASAPQMPAPTSIGSSGSGFGGGSSFGGGGGFSGGGGGGGGVGSW